MDSKGVLKGLEKEEWIMIDRILSYSNADSISKITPIDLLRYLITGTADSESDIKLIKYTIPKSWITKENVTQLMPFVYAKKKSRQIQSIMSSFASPKNSTIGLEAMHLINLYRNQNYNYPELCFLCHSKKTQNEMADDYSSWWKAQ
ncbi:hypothetical protein GCM10011343_22110 [Flavobacterium orientale]|uniref:Uncharacterized protein n=1 Tax=Flavobacterium orientale TaxID=1756020 RepID=A0A916Y5I5_9FLAO|nr:hypothetical protein GCM10011343_22110 [Flavobacterium orientale]